MCTRRYPFESGQVEKYSSTGFGCPKSIYIRARSSKSLGLVVPDDGNGGGGGGFRNCSGLYRFFAAIAVSNCK